MDWPSKISTLERVHLLKKLYKKKLKRQICVRAVIMMISCPALNEQLAT